MLVENNFALGRPGTETVNSKQSFFIAVVRGQPRLLRALATHKPRLVPHTSYMHLLVINIDQHMLACTNINQHEAYIGQHIWSRPTANKKTVHTKPYGDTRNRI